MRTRPVLHEAEYEVEAKTYEAEAEATKFGLEASGGNIPASTRHVRLCMRRRIKEQPCSTAMLLQRGCSFTPPPLVGRGMSEVLQFS